MQIDLNELPYPVAKVYRRLLLAKRHKDPDRIIQLCLDLLETTLNYVATVGIAASNHLQIRNVSSIFLPLLCKPRTIGDNLTIYEYISSHMPSEAQAEHLCIVQEGIEDFISNARNLISQRNSLVHENIPTISDSKNLAQELERESIELIQSLYKLFHAPLYSVFERISNNALLVLNWTGTTEPNPLTEPVHSPPDIHLREEDTFLYLNQSKWIRLAPFLTVQEDYFNETFRLLIFLRLYLKKNKIVKIDYKDLVSGEKIVFKDFNEDFSSKMIEELSHYFGFHKKQESISSIDDKRDSTYPIVQRAILNELSRKYYPRGELDEQLKTFASTHLSGVFVVEGDAGVGKTTWLASKILEYDGIHHLSSEHEGRNTIKSMLQSLIYQLCEHYEITRNISASDTELYTTYSNLLFDVGLKSSKPVFIMIDAIDELSLPQSGHLPFIPEILPTNIYFVLTSRPSLVPRSLESTLSAIEYVRIRNFSPLQIYEVARVHSLSLEPTDIETASTISEGNPRIALWYLTWKQQNPNEKLNPGAGTDSIFKKIFAQLYKNKHREFIYSILSLLITAYEPLSISFISAITGMRKREIADLLKPALPILHVENNFITPAHKLVKDYLTDPENPMALEKEDIRKAHRAYALISKEELPQSGEHYLEKYQINHMYRAGLYKKVFEAVDSVELHHEQLADAVINKIFEDGALDNELFSAAATHKGGSTSGKIIVRIVQRILDARATRMFEDFRAQPHFWDILTKSDAALLELFYARCVSSTSEVIDKAHQILSFDVDNQTREEALFILAEGQREAGRHREAYDNYRKCVRYSEESGNQRIYETASLYLCDLEYVYGNLEEAYKKLEELLINCTKNERASMFHSIYKCLGHIELVRNKYHKAIEHYSNGMEWATRSGSHFALGEITNCLAEAYTYIDRVRAREYLKGSLTHLEACDGLLEQGKAFYILADIDLRDGDIEGAQESLQRSFDILMKVNYGSGIARARLIQAALAKEAGNYEECFHAAREASLYYVAENIYPSWRAYALRLCRECITPLALSESHMPDTFTAIPYQEHFPKYME